MNRLISQYNSPLRSFNTSDNFTSLTPKKSEFDLKGVRKWFFQFSIYSSFHSATDTSLPLVSSRSKATSLKALTPTSQNYYNQYLGDWNKNFDTILYHTASHYGSNLRTGHNEIPLGVLCISNFGGGFDNERVTCYVECMSNLLYLLLATRLEYTLNKKRHRRVKNQNHKKQNIIHGRD